MDASVSKTRFALQSWDHNYGSRDKVNLLGCVFKCFHESWLYIMKIYNIGNMSIKRIVLSTA